MFNITGELCKKPEFEEVRYLKKKVRDIGNEGHCIDNSAPKTLNFAKKLTEYR